jgi:hypothetical protein
LRCICATERYHLKQENKYYTHTSKVFFDLVVKHGPSTDKQRNIMRIHWFLRRLTGMPWAAGKTTQILLKANEQTYYSRHKETTDKMYNS